MIDLSISQSEALSVVLLYIIIGFIIGWLAKEYQVKRNNQRGKTK